ncbi:MAG: hypothetical protein JNM26_00765 [Ideonella sp.]|nr:hypothetical protein [Ideonella sp.]
MPEWNPDRRIQRREFKDYQPLLMLVNSVDSVDAATRREFICINGPVWRRYNDTTRRSRERRITVLFLSNEDNTFDELLFVGCDALKRREHRCRVMWSHPEWPVDDALARRACITLAGRSVLRVSSLWPTPHAHPSVPTPPRLRRLATAGGAALGLPAPGLSTA